MMMLCAKLSILTIVLITTSSLISGKEGSMANEYYSLEQMDKELNVPEELANQTTNATKNNTIDVTNDVFTWPDDVTKSRCSVLHEYGQWAFPFKYSMDEIGALLCRCNGVCDKVIVSQDVKDMIHRKRYDPLAEKNRPEFIGVVTVFAILFLLGTVGNITTIIGLLKWMKHKTPTFAFMISLSCSDLLLLCVCMPIKVTEYFHLGNIFTEFTCKLSYYLRDFILICSVLTLTVISFERYYAICRPLVVQYRCTWRRARKIIVVLWLLSSCLAIPTAFMTQYYRPAGLRFWECLPQSHSELLLKLYFSYYMGILFVLPTVVMCFTYGRSCHSLWKSTVVTRKLQGTKRESSAKVHHSAHGFPSKVIKRDSDDIRSRRRVIKVLIWIVVVFVLCWGPPLLAQLLSVMDVIRQNRNKIRLATEALTYVSSTINPYLFMAMSSQFCPKSVPCIRFFRRRDTLSFTSGKESMSSMQTATTPALQTHEEQTTALM